MSGVTFIGARGNQTHDDYLIGLIYKIWKGDGDNPDLAPFPLTPSFELKLIAIGELYRLDELDPQEEFDENGSRLVTKVYNLPESVYHDLEMTDYGRAPLVPHLFPILDSFSVVGKSDDAYAGFDLDFFPGNIRPTKARAFAQSPSKNSVQKLVSEIFCFKNAQGKSAYTIEHTGRKIIDLEPHMEEKKIECEVCDAELRFKLKNGKPYNDIVLEMMDFVTNNPHFNPAKYILKHYDFEIDFGPEAGKAEFSKRYQKLMERVQRVFEKKAKRHAA